MTVAEYSRYNNELTRQSYYHYSGDIFEHSCYWWWGIGSNFVRYWLTTHPDDRVVILDALTYAGNLENLDTCINVSNLRFLKGNIRDSEQPDLIFNTESIDRVVQSLTLALTDRF